MHLCMQTSLILYVKYAIISLIEKWMFTFWQFDKAGLIQHIELFKLHFGELGLACMQILVIGKRNTESNKMSKLMLYFNSKRFLWHMNNIKQNINTQLSFFCPILAGVGGQGVSVWLFNFVPSYLS